MNAIETRVLRKGSPTKGPVVSLTKNEFKTLYAILRSPGATQRDIAVSADISLGAVNKALACLTDDGLVDEGRVTAAGISALEPYRVKNAVVMAAGLSSRFAPISYEKPKGLLRVRGKILIERQIEQLKEAGIDDIIVVVGYKKEYFFYLEEKYGVHIVVNRDFALRNNSSTLWVVKEVLDNTYICSSDDYFTVNPFEQYVWKAYYAVQYQEGPTKEWCIKTGSHKRIKSVRIGGKDEWYMIGHAYFDRAFSKTFVRILEEEYALPQTADKLWEHLYAEHVDEFDMVARRYPDGTIFEFDSLDEVREFDPLFLENLDSEVFDNITKVLGCKKSEIRDVYPLKQGITNLSCHFRTDEGEYVYRHPGIGTELIINRKAEEAAQKVAKELGIDTTFIYEDAERGWKISRFVPGARTLDPHDAGEVAQALQIAARLHQQPVSIDCPFDFYDDGKGYEKHLLERGPIDIPGYWEMSDQAKRLHELVLADNAPHCLTHNDFFYLNFLVAPDGRIDLIDWEYAGMSDYACDFGTFVVCGELSKKEALAALEAYFGRKPTEAEVRHNFAHVGLAGWCWYVWALLKEAEGDCVGEWLYIYYKYAKKYLKKALKLYEESGAEE